jgi:glyoxylase-like metal-dependent hydrolase (beta-lactamase superfamily II)
VSVTEPPGRPAPKVGGPVTARAHCVLAPNPGPMTLDGTNTWILAEPGATRTVVVDPGPSHEGHLRTALKAATGGTGEVGKVGKVAGRRVALVLLTHGHADHAAGARRFAELAGAPVRALDPAHRLGSEGLDDGEVLEVDGLVLRVVATPGHTADSLSFLLEADQAVLTGDTVLGRGTSVVAHPDGRLADYLASLRRLAELADAAQATTVLPGHGPVLSDAAGVLGHYLRHRQDRLDQVRDALAAGDRTSAEVVRRVYADTAPALWPAAELSVRAQLEYLARGT